MEMDSLLTRNDNGCMARRPKNVERLYIGEWIEFLGTKKQHEIAAEVKITEGYLTQLISREKVNPAHWIVKRIAGALGIGMGALYLPPPSREMRAAFPTIGFEQLAIMQTMRDRAGQ